MPLLPFRIVLCDQNEPVVLAWEREFAGCRDVDVRLGDFFDVQADAYVSPANSYGFMDGGFDLALRDHFGFEIQDGVQEAIVALGARLPVGHAIVVETGNDETPFLVVAPTMETPSLVSHTFNAYDAMRALLTAVQEYNAGHPGAIEVIGVPGLCTGIGGMDPRDAARQMRQAYDDHLAETRI